VLTAIGAFLLSIILSILTVLPFVPAGDDAPGNGLLWFLVIVGEASLLVPFSLGVTAELIQRKIQRRPFRWSKALLRFACALPIAIGPAYAVLFVMPYIDSRRPVFWEGKEIVAYGVSAASAYFALRIARDNSGAVAIPLNESA
jgi:hypothetical protein